MLRRARVNFTRGADFVSVVGWCTRALRCGITNSSYHDAVMRGRPNIRLRVTASASRGKSKCGESYLAPQAKRNLLVSSRTMLLPMTFKHLVRELRWRDPMRLK